MFFADTGVIDIANDRSTLSGNVLITTSSGYKINAEQLIAAMTDLSVESPNEIIAVGPIGTITAGSMLLNAPENGGNAQLVFTDDVKLVYEPEIIEE